MIALNPLEEEKQVQTDVLLFTDLQGHSQLSAALASLRLTEASEEFPDWYSAALLACPWNLRESFYDLRERVHSKPLIALLDGAFEQTIVCRIE